MPKNMDLGGTYAYMAPFPDDSITPLTPFRPCPLPIWPQPTVTTTAGTTMLTSDPEEPSIWNDGATMLSKLDEALTKHPTVSRKALIAVLVAAAEEDVVGLAGVLAGDGPTCCPSSGEPHGMHAPGCGEADAPDEGPPAEPKAYPVDTRCELPRRGNLEEGGEW